MKLGAVDSTLIMREDRDLLNVARIAKEVVTEEDVELRVESLKSLPSLKTNAELRDTLARFRELLSSGEYKQDPQAVAKLGLKPTDLNILRYNQASYGKMLDPDAKKVGFLTELRGVDLEAQLFLISLGAQTTKEHFDAISRRVVQEAEEHPDITKKYEEAMHTGKEAIRAERAERFALAESTEEFLTIIDHAEQRVGVANQSPNLHDFVDEIAFFEKHIPEITSEDHPDLAREIVSRANKKVEELADRIPIASLLSENREGELLIAKIIEKTATEDLTPRVLNCIAAKCQTSPTLQGMLTGAFEDAYLSQEITKLDKERLQTLEPEWMQVDARVRERGLQPQVGGVGEFGMEVVYPGNAQVPDYSDYSVSGFSPPNPLRTPVKEGPPQSDVRGGDVSNDGKGFGITPTRYLSETLPPISF